MLNAIGWGGSTAAAWQRILRSVRTFADLEPELLGRVEELIDFVTGRRDELIVAGTRWEPAVSLPSAHRQRAGGLRQPACGGGQRVA